MFPSKLQLGQEGEDPQGKEGQLVPHPAVWHLSHTVAGHTWRKEAEKHELDPMTTAD